MPGPFRPVRWILRWLVLGPILLAVAFFSACALLLALYRVVPPPVTAVQVQRVVEATLGPGDLNFQRRWRPADEISVHLPRAVVAAEDTRFFQHRGIDFVELEQARATARRTGRPPRGASTITQQLVKNLFLTTHRSYVRKGVELPLALLAEVILPKERILELYVNVVEWGPGVYGAEAAARYHYNTSADRLTREQSARLAALLPAPRSRTPGAVSGYSRTILTRMGQMGW
jgi:monofunctional glycosyltransferase